MAERPRRSGTKLVDYNRLNTLGFSDTSSKISDCEDLSVKEKIMHAQDIFEGARGGGGLDIGQLHGTPKVQDSRRFIDSMEDVLNKLQHEEESLRLALKLEEKRQTVQILRAVIEGSQNR